MILLWLACTGNTDITIQYQEDPQKVIADLQQIENPIEQLQLVEQLSKAFPGQTTELCALLRDKDQAYCLEQNLRPHLWMPSKEKQFSSKTEQQVDEHNDCQTQSCIQQLALSSARSGNIAKVQQICAQLQSSKWVDECIFMAAEESVSIKGTQNYAVGVELCLKAGNFQENCQFHLIQKLAQKAPDAHSLSDWQEIWRGHHAIQSAWSWRNPEFQKILLSRLWSEALGLGFAGVDQITGNALEHIPKEYRHHLHSAAVLRAFQLEEIASRNLMQWSQYLIDQLSIISEKKASVNQQRKFRAASNLWVDTDSQEAVGIYLVTSKRWIAQTDVEDIQIAILEAVARHPPVQMSLLEEGLQSNYPLVVQTAKRLLTQIQSQ